MRTPSIKTLSRVFDNPKEAKRIFLMDRDQLIETDAGAQRYHECYTPPKTHDIRLHCLNKLGEFFGVEAIETTKGEFASYLNAGDTYAETIIYWRGQYRIQSIGEFIESLERRHIYFK